jgi:hypothetical protein
MDKVQTIFSVLTHNYDVMLWFWLIITLPVGFLHLYSFPSKKSLPEKELAKISSEFIGINSKYLIFSFFWALILIFLLVVQGPKLDNWAIQNYGIRFYPAIVIFTAGYGIYQGTFAIFSGVYPMAKSLSFIYDDTNQIQRIATYQILISIAAIVLATTFFFLTAR